MLTRTPRIFAVLLVALAMLFAIMATSRATPKQAHDRLPRPVEAQEPTAQPLDGGDRTETIFGFYTLVDGEPFAVQGETWTFDHGAADPLEGMQSRIGGLRSGPFGRFIDAGSWVGHGNVVAAPIISGSTSAWIGVFEDEADDLCYAAGLGYGNDWCERLLGPPLSYDGSGSVLLSFAYFNDTEDGYDFTRVLLHLGNGVEVPVNGSGFTGRIGNPASHGYSAFSTSISQAMFQGQTSFQLVFEVSSDAAASDQDGGYPTNYGPFGVDDIGLTNNIVEGNQSWDFEGSDHGFTQKTCGIGPFLSVHDVSGYTLEVPCSNLVGNVMTLHDESFGHPEGQSEMVVTPIVDLTEFTGVNGISAEFDLYAKVELNNPVKLMMGWQYYPVLCAATGGNSWSDWTGSQSILYFGANAVCLAAQSNAIAAGVPANAQQVRFVFQVLSCCNCGWPCGAPVNPTPLVDNMRIRVTHQPSPGAVDGGTDLVPSGLSIDAMYPNPGNGSAHVVLEIPRRGDLEAGIYATDGRMVRNLGVTSVEPGSFRLIWDGRDDHGTEAGPGVYHLRCRLLGGPKGAQLLGRKILRVR